MTEPKAKTYRKAFIEVHKAQVERLQRNSDVITEAQAKKLVNRKPSPGSPVLIAVDTIRTVHAMHTTQSAQFSVVKGKTRTDVWVEADVPIEYARIFGVGERFYDVHETVTEVRALIDDAMRKAVAP